MVLSLFSSLGTIDVTLSPQARCKTFPHSGLDPTCDSAKSVWLQIQTTVLTLKLPPFSWTFQRLVSISTRRDSFIKVLMDTDTWPRQRTIPFSSPIAMELWLGRYPQVAVFVFWSRRMQCIWFLCAIQLQYNIIPQYTSCAVYMVLVKKEATFILDVAKCRTDWVPHLFNLCFSRKCPEVAK